MNFCFEKFVDFRGIMSDGLDRIVASKKQCPFFNPIKITQKNVIFSYFIKLQEYWGNFQSSYETKKSIENILRLILDEAVMSDRHMLDGQKFATFFNTEKNELKLNTGQHYNRLLVAYIHCDTLSINNKPLKIRKKHHAA